MSLLLVLAIGAQSVPLCSTPLLTKSGPAHSGVVIRLMALRVCDDAGRAGTFSDKPWLPPALAALPTVVPEKYFLPEEPLALPEGFSPLLLRPPQA